jgi:hypothetical protein
MTEYNVRDFDAVGNGLVDDYDSIAAAIAEAMVDGGGSIYFPAGRYAIARRNIASGLWFRPGTPPLRFVGDGPEATALVMLAGTYHGDFYMLRVEGDALELEGLTLDGNRANIPVYDEQTHLVQLHDCRRFVARDVEFKGARGDGIKAVGSGGTHVVEDVLVTGCTFRNNGRSGITVQRAIRDVRIVDNLFVDTSDQDIDFEPSGMTAPCRILIRGNLVEHTTAPGSITLSGISGADRSADVIVEGNIVNGGSISGIDLRDMIVKGNRVRARPGQRAFDFSRGVDNLLLEGNIVSASEAEGAIAIQATNGRGPVGVTVKGNAIKNVHGHGLIMNSCASVLVTDNRIVDEAGVGVRGIQARATSVDFPVRSTRIVGNLIEGFAWGVSVNASQNAGCIDVAVEGNTITNRQVPGTTTAKKIGVELTVTLDPVTHQAIHPLVRVVATNNLAGEGINVALVQPA